MSRFRTTAVLALGLWACGDTSIKADPFEKGLKEYVWTGVTGASGPLLPSSAQPLFDTNVAPILNATCAGSDCHSAPGSGQIRFLPEGGTDLYGSVLQYGDRLVAGTFNKADAQMLTRVAAGHYTATYTPTDLTRIEEWLDAEAAARVDQPGVPSVSRRMMSEMSGCMSLQDWMDEEVAEVWALKETNEGECQQCHMNGQGWLASLDAERVFTVLRNGFPNPASGGLMMELYFGADVSDPAAPKLIINRPLLERAGSGHGLHPRFDVEGEEMERLERFYAKTVIRRASFQCDPPQFEP